MTDSKHISPNELLAVIEWFKENFTSAFPREASAVKPLQLGIIDEILEFASRLDTPPFSNKRIRAALGYYTLSPAYLKAQKPGAPRVDLYGNEIEMVTPEQAEYAKAKFDLRYSKKKDNKQKPQVVKHEK